MASISPQHAEVLARHVAAESAHDMEGTLATLTADCRFEDMPSGHVYIGHAGVRAYYERWWSAFGVSPDGGRLHMVDESTLVAETRFVGKHVGEWEGVAATGRPISLPVAIIVTFSGGLMSGERFNYDRSSLMQQIGSGAATP
jgi:predicted ester cyclase